MIELCDAWRSQLSALKSELTGVAVVFRSQPDARSSKLIAFNISHREVRGLRRCRTEVGFRKIFFGERNERGGG